MRRFMRLTSLPASTREFLFLPLPLICPNVTFARCVAFVVFILFQFGRRGEGVSVLWNQLEVLILGRVFGFDQMTVFDSV